MHGSSSSKAPPTGPASDPAGHQARTHHRRRHHHHGEEGEPPANRPKSPAEGMPPKQGGAPQRGKLPALTTNQAASPPPPLWAAHPPGASRRWRHPKNLLPPAACHPQIFPPASGLPWLISCNGYLAGATGDRFARSHRGPKRSADHDPLTPTAQTSHHNPSVRHQGHKVVPCSWLTPGPIRVASNRYEQCRGCIQINRLGTVGKYWGWGAALCA